jgi:hypothetical protein
MSTSAPKQLTGRSPLAAVFLEPSNPTHRQYEALRARFVEGLPSHRVARSFGYSPGSFRVLCCEFRRNPRRQFFLPGTRPRKVASVVDPLRARMVALRKQNLSIYDISRTLEQAGRRVSPANVSAVLREEGFARLPRRRDEERPPACRPDAAAVADVRQLDLSPRRFRTSFGGLFLFVPYLARLSLDKMVEQAGYPGTKMVPAGHAMRSLLGLKLFGGARHSHVMSDVMDEGLALFAGLNAIPKRAFLTEYSSRIDPACHRGLMPQWFHAISRLGMQWGASFDLDFHTIPYHGDDALVQKHYVSKRSRRQKGILAFLARDADQGVFCYANAEVRKEQQNDEILSFLEYWKERTSHYPEEAVFDSRLTTYANLSRVNQLNIKFITLRRRSEKILREAYLAPPSAWKRVQLEGIGRIYRTPRVLDQTIELDGYDGPIRQLIITDLGHEEPTLLLTNYLGCSAAKLIKRYAQRMIIENGIADGIDFFHMDALSSAVAMKVNCDLQLTLMASSLYRLLGSQIGGGYERAKSRVIFQDFVHASAQLQVSERDILVRFQKRAHNPYLLAAGFDRTEVRVPWLGHKRLQLVFG